MKEFAKAVVVGAALLLAPSAAFAEGDAAKGEQVFKKCTTCHVVNDEKNRVGPYLKGLVGRTAGTAEKYKYSSLNAAAGEAGLVWTEENLFAYLEDPSKFLVEFLKANGAEDKAKGRSKMVYKLSKEDERNDVIAYLKTISEPKTN